MDEVFDVRGRKELTLTSHDSLQARRYFFRKTGIGAAVASLRGLHQRLKRSHILWSLDS
jgi:hypothetical protein